MTIKKRIFITNTLIVFMSLIILLGAAGTSVAVFKDEFLTEYSNNSRLSNYSAQAQNILNEADKYNGNWKGLSNNLKEYDFRLFVSDVNSKKKKKPIYSELTHREKEAVEGLLKSESKKDGIYFIENTTIISKNVSTSTGSYVLYGASSQGNSFMGIGRGMFEEFIISFIVLGLLCVGIILLCSQIATKLLIKKIMIPVNQLDIASKRVTTGYLSTPINYSGNDEFKNVCDSFDSMQLHLKEGIEKNNAYEKARREMISGISHDLRTPLTSVKGYIKGMIDGIANTDEKRNQYLKVAYKKACDMDILLEKLFYFSKLETGNMPLYKKPVNIYDYIEDYAEDKKFELKEKGIELNYEKKNYKEVFCSVDCQQIKRVFDNIIENTIKYAETNNIVINISANSNNDNVIIKLSDNGKGVDECKLKDIFEQFYRGDESRKDSGSGLGLYVCKYIIEEHNGKIWAENNNGLTIIIELPITKEDK